MNGVSMIFPQMLSVLVAAATLYLFGEKGIWYCLGAMCAANFISILVVVYTGGFSEFLQELYILLATFSKETGPLMMRLAPGLLYGGSIPLGGPAALLQ